MVSPVLVAEWEIDLPTEADKQLHLKGRVEAMYQKVPTKWHCGLPCDLSEWIDFKLNYDFNILLVSKAAYWWLAKTNPTWVPSSFSEQTPISVIVRKVEDSYRDKHPTDFEKNGIEQAHFQLRKWITSVAKFEKISFVERGEDRVKLKNKLDIEYYGYCVPFHDEVNIERQSNFTSFVACKSWLQSTIKDEISDAEIFEAIDLLNKDAKRVLILRWWYGMAITDIQKQHFSQHSDYKVRKIYRNAMRDVKVILTLNHS